MEQDLQLSRIAWWQPSSTAVCQASGTGVPLVSWPPQECKSQESKQAPGWINCLHLHVMLLPGSLLDGDSSAAQPCTVWGQHKAMR